MSDIVLAKSQRTLTIFISYTHRDEELKDQLLAHLRALPIAQEIDLWSEDQIGAGEDWLEKMREAMSQATIAILLVSTNFLGSKFILNNQIPTLLERRESEGLIVLPIIARHCPWEKVGWLAKMRVRPKDHRPVWSGGRIRAEKELTAIVSEVAHILEIDLLFNEAWEFHIRQDWVNAEKSWQKLVEMKVSRYRGHNVEDMQSEANKRIQEQKDLYEKGMDAHRIGEWAIARGNFEQLKRINTIYTQQSIQALLDDTNGRIRSLENSLPKEGWREHQARNWAKAEEIWQQLLNLGVNTYRNRKVEGLLTEAREERRAQEERETLFEKGRAAQEAQNWATAEEIWQWFIDQGITNFNQQEIQQLWRESIEGRIRLKSLFERGEKAIHAQDWDRAEKIWQELLIQGVESYSGHNIPSLLQEAKKQKELKDLFERGRRAHELQDWVTAGEIWQQLSYLGGETYEEQSIQLLLVEAQNEQLKNLEFEKGLKAHQEQKWQDAENIWQKFIEKFGKIHNGKDIQSLFEEARSKRIALEKRNQGVKVTVWAGGVILLVVTGVGILLNLQFSPENVGISTPTSTGQIAVEPSSQTADIVFAKEITLTTPTVVTPMKITTPVIPVGNLSATITPVVTPIATVTVLPVSSLIRTISMPPPPIYGLTAEEALERIRADQVITVGVRYDAPPYGNDPALRTIIASDPNQLDTLCNPSVDNLNFYPVGYDIDIIKEFIRRWLGNENAIKFRCVPLPERIPTAYTGIVRIGAYSLSKLPERCASLDDPLNPANMQVWCSESYMLDGLGVLVHKGSGIDDLCDVDGKTVAVIRESSAAALFLEEANRFCNFSQQPTLKLVDTREEAITRLLSESELEKVDAYSTNVEILNALANEPHYQNDLKLVPGEFGPEEEFSIAVTPGEQGLFELINRTIQAMKDDGTLAELMKRARLICAVSDTAVPNLCGLVPITEPFDYTVQAGETLGGIAIKMYGNYELWTCLADKNGIVDPKTLHKDQILKIIPDPCQ